MSCHVSVEQRPRERVLILPTLSGQWPLRCRRSFAHPLDLGQQRVAFCGRICGSDDLLSRVRVQSRRHWRFSSKMTTECSSHAMRFSVALGGQAQVRTSMRSTWPSGTGPTVAALSSPAMNDTAPQIEVQGPDLVLRCGHVACARSCSCAVSSAQCRDIHSRHPITDQQSRRRCRSQRPSTSCVGKSRCPP